MASTIIGLIFIMLSSMIFGYCIRWMLEEETIVYQIKTNKQKKILPPLN